MRYNFSDKKLEEFVVESPNPTLNWNAPVCPQCGSKDLEEGDEVATCVGWFPKTPEDDTPDCPGNPNTTTVDYPCLDCNCSFLYQVRFGNICVLEDQQRAYHRKIFRGVPWGVSVSEKYSCKECNGKLVAKQYHVAVHKIVLPTEGQSGYDLTCLGCKLQIRIKSGAGFEPHVPYDNGLPKGPWLLETREGICVANSKAIRKKN